VREGGSFSEEIEKEIAGTRYVIASFSSCR
jgi:hypothetical protein